MMRGRAPSPGYPFLFVCCFFFFFFFSSRRRHTRSLRDWSSDVCSSDLREQAGEAKSKGERHEIDQNVHQVPLLARIALIVTSSDEPDIAKAAIKGVKIGRASCRERV